MSKKSKLTSDEKSQHEAAVKIRKMTDQQLCEYLEEQTNKSFALGEKVAKEAIKSRKDDSVQLFLQRLSSMSGTGRGFGKATIEKIKTFAKEDGFLGI